MSLRAPSRLPKRLNRRAGPLMRSVAHTTCHTKRVAELRRKKRRARWTRRIARLRELVASEFRFWVILVASAMVIVIASILLFAPLFDIRAIQIRKQDPRIDLEEVQEALLPLFGQRLVLVSRGQVSALLQSQFPDIARIDVGKNYPSTLSVTIVMKPVVAEIIIEDTERKEQSGETASGSTLSDESVPVYTYVTEDGFLVASRIPLATPSMGVLHVTDWTVRPQNRALLMEPEFLRTVTRTRDSLRRDFGLESKRIVIYLDAQEYHIQTEKFALWFDLQSPLSSHMQRFRDFLASAGDDAAKEYVDLRMKNMVIYK